MRAISQFVLAALAANALLAGCGGDSSTDGGPGTDAGPVDAMSIVDVGPVDMPPVDLGVDFGPEPACAVPVIPAIHAADIAMGHRFPQATAAVFAPGDDDTVYVVERAGGIVAFHQSTGMLSTFLDITATLGVLSAGGQEQGLLGLAFHPNYQSNGRFFVAYTPLTGSSGHNILAEYHRSATDPFMADPTEDHQLFSTMDPEWNHDGGWVAFGPDGFLYTTIGDGGGGCDNHGGNGNGQNTNILLGKMLRLDVDNAPSYAAAGNPFASGGGLPQIWAYGLRNAWRNSFDRRTGDLYMGDVGQDHWEEIDFQPAGDPGGENYGWRYYEGTHVASHAPPDGSSCATVTPMPTGTVMPITEYSHTNDHVTPLAGGIAVTGGYVYRGSAIPELDGVYLYADYGTGKVAALRYCGGAVQGPIDVPSISGLDNISSFGEGNDGELFMVGLNGTVFKILPGAS